MNACTMTTVHGGRCHGVMPTSYWCHPYHTHDAFHIACQPNTTDPHIVCARAGAIQTMSSKRHRPGDMPKGGSRQVSAWSVPESASQGHLAKLLLSWWAWGELSAHQVQKLSAASVADGSECSHLNRLAKLGASGACERHCHEQLLRVAKPTPLHTSLVTIELPMLNPVEVDTVPFTILFPHEVFAMMYTCHPDQFVKRMCGGSESKVAEFWDGMVLHPSMVNHPTLSQVDERARCIPISLHGDGVPVSGLGKAWSRSVEIYSWASALSNSSTAMSQIMICLFHKLLVSKTPGRDTMLTFWKHMVWSFKWMMLGLWPDVDANGKPYPRGSLGWDRHHRQKWLAGGWKGVLWCLKGDLEYFALSLGLEHFSSKTPCFLCPCNSSDCPWTDVRPDQAKWVSKVWDKCTWPSGPANGRHPVFDIPGMTITNVLPDLLHVKHLGTDSWFYGSVLTLLVKQMLPGTISVNFDQVWQDLRANFSTMGTPCRYTSMKESMFIASNGFPKLKGTGSQMRYLVKPLAATFAKFMDRENQEHRQVLLGLKLSSRFEDILQVHSHEIRLPSAAHAELLKVAFGFDNIVTSLGNKFHARGEQYFNFTIKFHYLLHIAMYSRYINPMAVWCYGGEGFMQVVKKLVISCQTGTKPALVGNKVLAKYAQGFGYDLIGTDEEWWH
jgi:hypothetical protein